MRTERHRIFGGALRRLLCGAVASLLALPAWVSGAAWTSPLTLSLTGVSPSVSIDPDGATYVVWVEPSVELGTVGKVMAQTILPDGTLGPRELLGDGGQSPVVAASRDVAIAAWLTLSGTDFEVRARVRRNGDWGPAVLLDSFTPAGSVGVDVAVDGAGNGMVVWAAGTPGLALVASGRGYLTSSGWGAVTQLTTTAGRAPRVTASPGGLFLAAWPQVGPPPPFDDTSVLEARMWHPAGTWGAVEQTALRGDDFDMVVNDDATAVVSSFRGARYFAFADANISTFSRRAADGTWTILPAVPTNPVTGVAIGGGGDGQVSAVVTTHDPLTNRLIADAFDLTGDGRWHRADGLSIEAVTGDSRAPTSIGRNRTGDTVVLSAFCPVHEFGPLQYLGFVRSRGDVFRRSQVEAVSGFNGSGCSVRPRVAVSDSGRAVVLPVLTRGVWAALFDAQEARPRVPLLATVRLSRLVGLGRVRAGRAAAFRFTVTIRAPLRVWLERREHGQWTEVRSKSVVGGPGVVRVGLRMPRAGRYRLVVSAGDSMQYVRRRWLDVERR